jgi:hypothetical protein
MLGTRRVSMVVAIGALPFGAAAQVQVGDVVPKEALMATLPPDSLHEESRELVRATTGSLSVMRARIQDGEVSGGVVEHGEVFIALHARRGMGAEGAYDSGVAAVRTDTLFQVLLTAETDLGFVTRLEAVAPPRDASPISLLHLRYAQTGSGGVTEDFLYALDSGGALVDVPIEDPDLSAELRPGEYGCCGRFTSFDEDLVELTVFFTNDGRRGITDRVRVRYALEGRYRLDEEAKRYEPDFRLAVQQIGPREPAK